MQEKHKNIFLIPVSIAIAGLLIAGAVVLSNRQETTPEPKAGITGETQIDGNTAPSNKQEVEKQKISIDNIMPITQNDNILGRHDAEVIIVTYSDFRCPFCQQFHDTTKKIMDEFGKSGQVALVYRHFPIMQNSQMMAIASECAAEIGGNKSFWEFVNVSFEYLTTRKAIDTTALTQLVEKIGLDKTGFSACMVSGKHDAKVQKDKENGFATGAEGAPWSILVARNGQKLSLNGAQPYEKVKELIELALKNKPIQN